MFVGASEAGGIVGTVVDVTAIDGAMLGANETWAVLG
jgi:hypothetical protein